MSAAGECWRRTRQCMMAMGASRGSAAPVDCPASPSPRASGSWMRTRAVAAGRPVISVDTKKKELIGNYENQGRQWRKSKSPDLVNGHDFPAPSVPRAYPYGVYDLARNKGFVNVGTDHGTGAFAVASLRGWWRFEGHRLYPRARRLLITADGGGSNGYRLRVWKLELAQPQEQIYISRAGATV